MTIFIHPLSIVFLHLKLHESALSKKPTVLFDLDSFHCSMLFPPCELILSTLHEVAFGGLLLTMIDFMIHPGGHASTHAAENDISDEVNASNNRIVPFTVNANVEARSNDCKTLQTVVAPNDTNVVGVQTKAVPFHNHSLRSTDGHSGAAKPFQTHATLGTATFTHFARLRKI
jgi:hypothetical protein